MKRIDLIALLIFWLCFQALIFRIDYLIYEPLWEPPSFYLSDLPAMDSQPHQPLTNAIDF